VYVLKNLYCFEENRRFSKILILNSSNFDFLVCCKNVNMTWSVCLWYERNEISGLLVCC